MIWILVILFAALSILFLRGKGSFLILGYNTASEEAKKEYDEKKLCRVMGSGMGVVALCLLVMAILGEPPMWVQMTTFVIVAVTVIVMLILSNTICKIKTSAEYPKKNTAEFSQTMQTTQIEKSEPISSEDSTKLTKVKKRKNKLTAGVILFNIILFTGIGILLSTGDIHVTTDNKQVEIQGSYWPDFSVSLEEIQNISYTDQLDTGSRVNGLGSFRLREGKFQNKEFGKYILYAYAKCSSYVLLETKNQVIAVNAATRKETKELYDQLQKVVKSR